MKTHITRLRTGVLTLSIASLLLFGGCDKKEESDHDKNRKIMSSSWIIENVMIDGEDHTDLFMGMELSFTATTYSTIHGGEVWPPSGTWEFLDKKARIVLRDDGVEVTILDIHPTNLVLELVWNSTTYGPGRSKSISGVHVFDFKKK